MNEMRFRLGSPLAVEMLIHYHASCRRREDDHLGPQQEIIEAFLRHKVIEQRNGFEAGCYQTTALGRAWLKAVCDTVLPKTVFLDEHERQIEI